MPDWTLLAQEGGGAGQQRGILCDWLGERIWVCLVSPKWEAGTKLGKAVTY